MDIKDMMNVINDSKKQLDELLSDCRNDSAELALLAEKMHPLLTEVTEIQAELFSSLPRTDISDHSCSVALSEEDSE